MPSASKENNILRLILENSPLKEWHFEDITNQSGTTKASANKWLRKYVNEGLLHHVKEKGKHPFFTVGASNQIYLSRKRLYALEQLHNCGMIPRLLSIKQAKTIIIFGSIARGDWYKDSDIDLFILGNLTDFNKKHYETKLNRRIEVHQFRDKKEMDEVKTGLVKNIANGYVIKGQIQDFVSIA